MQTSAKKEAKHHHRTQTEISFAFVQTIPVMLGYLCLGIAFGLMLQDAGYHFLWAFVCSLCIYAGSPLFGTCASTGYYGNSGCILHEKYATVWGKSWPSGNPCISCGDSAASLEKKYTS